MGRWVIYSRTAKSLITGLRKTMGSVKILAIALAGRKGKHPKLVTEQTSQHTSLEDPQWNTWSVKLPEG